MPKEEVLMNRQSADEAMEKLRTALGNRLEIGNDDFFTTLTITADDVLPVMSLLREQLGMNYLANLTSTDQGDEFEVIYHLYAIPDNGLKLLVKTRVPRNQAELSSVIEVYPTADWQEREVYDLMGIRFSGHPNLVRVLLPDDFVGHPLRKDFTKEG